MTSHQSEHKGHGVWDLAGGFRGLLEEAPIATGVACADPSDPGRLLEVNRAFCMLTGYSREELLALGLGGIWAPEEAEAAERLWHQIAVGETRSFRSEQRYVGAEGRTGWICLAASVVDDDRAGPLAVLVHALDISERVRVEEHLRQDHQQLVEAQELAGVGSWAWDVRANTLTWSDQLYRIFGLAGEELEPTYEGFLARIHPDDREQVNQAVSAALAGEPYALDMRVVRPDGTTLETHARGRVVRDDEGAPVRMHGTSLDVTETRQAQEALRQATERMRLLHAVAVAANQASGIDETLQTTLDQVCAHIGWPVGHA